MHTRHDIFILRGVGDWSLYVQAVTPANARRIAGALEADRERVLICTHGRTLGKHVYQTPNNRS